MNSSKPLATLFIAFYNQESFVEDAVKGALSQTYENLEIILSDDCSTDKTFDEIKKWTQEYVGPHKIIINRNEKNLGLVTHMNKIFFDLSHGDYLFANGGDDVSLPNRIADGVDYFLKNNSVSGLTFASIYIDGEGKETKRMHLEKDHRYTITDRSYLMSRSFMCGIGMFAFKREVLNVFGPLNDDCQTEDSCLRFRALLLGDVIASAKYGVKYRIHGKNMSIGNVIFKLKTHPIAEQYRKDLEVVKESISPELYAILRKKINYYKINRETESVCALSSSKVKLFIFKIRRKLVAIDYNWRLTTFYNSI